MSGPLHKPNYKQRDWSPIDPDHKAYLRGQWEGSAGWKLDLEGQEDKQNAKKKIVK